MAAILSSRQIFLLEVIPEVEYTMQKDSHEHFRHFELLIDALASSNVDGDMSISKFDLLCDLVTSSMTSWVRET